jgi:hypothetical protein
MDDRYDLYRQKAAEAEAQSKRAKTDDDKAAWLRLVQDWLSLLPKRKRTPADKFDADLKTRGTHQEDSKSSH